MTLVSLVFSGAPILIPEPGDCPSVGCWTAQEVVAAAEFFRELPDVDDEEVEDLAAGVEEVRRWLAEAADRGDGLVGFYY